MRRQRGPHGRFLSKEEKEAQLGEGSFGSFPGANPSFGDLAGAPAGGVMTTEQREQATQAACSSTWAVLSRIRVRAHQHVIVSVPSLRVTPWSYE